MPRRAYFLPIIVLLISILGCSLPGTIHPAEPSTQTVIGPVATRTYTPGLVAPTDTVEISIPTRTATETLKFGTVSGNLSYPSEFIPAQRVIFYIANDFSQYYSVDTALNQSTYTIQVPEGMYVVVAYVIDGGLSAGYTAAVACGLSVDCTDHSLVPILVTAGETLEKIDPADWYAPGDSFPPLP